MILLCILQQVVTDVRILTCAKSVWRTILHGLRPTVEDLQLRIFYLWSRG
jgi:hypothetical protein